MIALRMKSLLKRLVPWYVRKTIGFARTSFASRKPPFHGVYADFASVKQTPGYNDQGWSDSSRFAAAQARNQIGEKIPSLMPHSKSLLPMLIMSRKGPVRILDFGGAAGLDFGNLSASLGAIPRDVSYVVVDTPGTCEAGRTIWQSENVTFASELPPGSERFDIVYAYSSLQYLDDFREGLRKIAAYRPAAILLCHHPIHFGKSFVRCQRNMGAGLEVPQWVFGFGDLTEAMLALGYHLSFREWTTAEYNVDNYEEAYRAARTANLMFVPR
jgi:putative methyltransferase (TIGR04325 family)